MIDNFYAVDCQLFRNINRYFDHKGLNIILQTITHTGGAVFTIAVTLLLMLFTNDVLQFTAIASALSLATSHLPVAIIKKLYPRRRPYIVLDQINVTANPLKDHSFPSGHTTAIFSVIIPFVLYYPFLAIILIPIASIVGLSRIYLGLHYPSDVIAGSILGSAIGVFSFMLIQYIFPHVFI